MFQRLVCQSGFFNWWTTNRTILSLQLNCDSFIWTGCITTVKQHMKIASCKEGITTWIWSWNENYQSDTICTTLWNTINVNHSLGHIRLKFRITSFGGSGAGVLTLRTPQRQKNPASAFKRSTRLENCKPAKPWQQTKLQANPPATNNLAIKVQAPPSLSKFKHFCTFSIFFWMNQRHCQVFKINFVGRILN